MRCRLGLVALTAVALLTGCGAPSGAPQAPDTAPATPSPTASETPAATPTPDPSASPIATPDPTATGPATPGTEAAPYCGDAYVLSTFSTAPVAWVGTEAEILEQAQAQGGFEAEGAIAGLDAHCTAVYRVPTDGGPGVATVSTALLPRNDAALAQLEQWAAANGYLPAPGTESMQFMERYAPANPDGTTTRKIFWAPLDGAEPMIGNAADIVALTGAPADAIAVWHSDFTRP